MHREEIIALLAAFYLSVISIAAIAVFYAEQKPVVGYTQLSLKEGAYTDTIDKGSIVFSFAIENREGVDMNYAIEYLLGTARIGNENIFVEKNKKIILSRSIKTRFTDPIFPAKFTIRAKNSVRKRFEVWFWLKHTS